MENTFIAAFLKWFLPSLFGSILAIRQKYSKTGWGSLDTRDKVSLCILAIYYISISIITSYFIGGYINETLLTDTTSFAYQLTYLVVATSSIKIIDKFSTNIDSWLNTISKGVTKFLNNFFGDG